MKLELDVGFHEAFWTAKRAMTAAAEAAFKRLGVRASQQLRLMRQRHRMSTTHMIAPQRAKAVPQALLDRAMRIRPANPHPPGQT